MRSDLFITRHGTDSSISHRRSAIDESRRKRSAETVQAHQRGDHPAYATFASPALFYPDQPVRQAPPDRWWVVDAISSQLLLLAEWEVLPFADGTWESVTLPSISRSIEQQQEDLAHFEACMDQVAPAFFAQSSDESGREEIRQMLAFMLPDILLPQYQALVPDFFVWLYQVR